MNTENNSRPFTFSVVEEDADTVVIEVSEADYAADIAAGLSEEETLKPGRHKFTRGGFLKRHPELKIEERKSA
jgi:hypothetical protein